MKKTIKYSIYVTSLFFLILMSFTSLGMAYPPPPPPPPLGCATSCTIYYGYGYGHYSDTWERDEGYSKVIAYEDYGVQLKAHVRFDVSNRNYKKLTIDARLLNWGQPMGSRLRWEVHYTNGFIEVLTPVNGGDTIHLYWGNAWPWYLVVDYIELDQSFYNNFYSLTADIDFIKFYTTI